jgi:hypothetical protein
MIIVGQSERWPFFDSRQIRFADRRTTAWTRRYVAYWPNSSALRVTQSGSPGWGTSDVPRHSRS